MAKELPEGMAIVALNPGVINTDMLASCFGDSASLYQAPDAWYGDLFALIYVHMPGSLWKQKEMNIAPLLFLIFPV